MIPRVHRLQIELPAPSDPDHAGSPADPPEEPAVFAPGFHPEDLKEIAGRLMQRA